MKNEDENWILIIEEIKKVQKKKKITDQQISDLTGIDQPNVNRALNKKTNPSLKTITSIMKALKIEVHLIY